jgi:hypothetical protein
MLRTAQCLGCFPDVFFNQRSNLWIGTATVELDVSSLRRVIMAQCDGGMRRRDGFSAIKKGRRSVERDGPRLRVRSYIWVVYVSPERHAERDSDGV